MTFPLAQKKDFLNEEGLEVEHIRIFGPVAMAALVNGDLDYWGAIGFSVRSAMQGVPVRVIKRLGDKVIGALFQARCSSTKSEIYHPRCKQSFCVFSRSGSSSASAALSRFASTSE